MRGHDDGPAVGVLLHQRASRRRRLHHVGIGAARQVRKKQLKLMVDRIAGEGTALAAALDVDHHEAGCVAGAWLKRYAFFEFEIVGHEDRLLGALDRHHAILERQYVHVVAIALGVHRIPVVVLALGHDVLGVGECRHEAAIDQARVPADVIPVQVGAHHVVDLLGFDAGCRQIRDVVGLDHVEGGATGARLVVAAAGVDQDRVPRRAQDEGMKTHQQVAASSDQRAEPRLALGQFLRRASRKELASDEGREFEFDQTIDGEISETGEGHGSASSGLSFVICLTLTETRRGDSVQGARSAGARRRRCAGARAAT